MSVLIGIDLDWRSDKIHRGGAVLDGDEHGVAIDELSKGIITLNEVQEFILRRAPVPTQMSK